MARLTGANVLPGLAGDDEAVVAHPWELSLAAERPGGAMAVPGMLHGVVPEGDRVRVRVGDVVVLVADGELERLGLERGRAGVGGAPAGPPRLVRWALGGRGGAGDPGGAREDQLGADAADRG